MENILHFGSAQYGCEYCNIITIIHFLLILLQRKHFFVCTRNSQLQTHAERCTAYTLFDSREFLSNVWRCSNAFNVRQLHIIITLYAHAHRNNATIKQQCGKIITSLFWMRFESFLVLSKPYSIFLEKFSSFYRHYNKWLQFSHWMPAFTSNGILRIVCSNISLCYFMWNVTRII